MKIVFLGTGGTYPCKSRNVASIAVQVPGEVIMFDCGEGTQRQLMHAPVSFMQVNRVFISHLHADHFLGLPGLIQSMSLNGREHPLDVYGPKGTARTVKALMNLGYFVSGFEVRANDLQPGAKLERGRFTVAAAAAAHTVPTLAFSLTEKPRPGKFDLTRAEALGLPPGPLYRDLQRGNTVEFKGKRIKPEQVLGPPRRGRKLVYSGDTKPSETVTGLAKGADVLIHDSTLDSAHSDLAASFGHSTAVEAAQVAKSAGVGTLFLFHFSPRYDETDLLEREAKTVFRNSRAARDLMEYVVRYRE
jgi:ribonuclease Z